MGQEIRERELDSVMHGENMKQYRGNGDRKAHAMETGDKTTLNQPRLLCLQNRGTCSDRILILKLISLP